MWINLSLGRMWKLQLSKWYHYVSNAATNIMWEVCGTSYVMCILHICYYVVHLAGALFRRHKLQLHSSWKEVSANGQLVWRRENCGCTCPPFFYTQVTRHYLIDIIIGIILCTVEVYAFRGFQVKQSTHIALTHIVKVHLWGSKHFMYFWTRTNARYIYKTEVVNFPSTSDLYYSPFTLKNPTLWHLYASSRNQLNSNSNVLSALLHINNIQYAQVVPPEAR